MLGARGLKRRYASKWPIAVRRELLVLGILNLYLPPGYRAVLSGLGAGSTELISTSYSGLGDAFDIVVLREAGEGLEPVAYLDVTGASGPAGLQEHKGLCIGEWKIWKAERYRAKNRTWFVHVEDDGPRTRWIPAAKLENEGKTHRLLGDEKPYICLDSKRWLTLKHFIKWLVAVSRAV